MEAIQVWYDKDKRSTLYIKRKRETLLIWSAKSNCRIYSRQHIASSFDFRRNNNNNKKLTPCELMTVVWFLFSFLFLDI